MPLFARFKIAWLRYLNSPFLICWNLDVTELYDSEACWHHTILQALFRPSKEHGTRDTVIAKATTSPHINLIVSHGKLFCEHEIPGR